MTSEQTNQAIKGSVVQESIEKIAALGGVGVSDVQRRFDKHRAAAMQSTDSGRGTWVACMESIRTPATTHLIDEAIRCMDAGDVAAAIRITGQLRALLVGAPSDGASCSSTGSTGHH